MVYPIRAEKSARMVLGNGAYCRQGAYNMQVRFTVTNNNPNTIYNKLKDRLGREPTSDECREECLRIMRGEEIEESKESKE